MIKKSLPLKLAHVWNRSPRKLLVESEVKPELRGKKKMAGMAKRKTITLHEMKVRIVLLILGIMKDFIIDLGCSLGGFGPGKIGRSSLTKFDLVLKGFGRQI